jgi:hypothetical protein
MQIHQFHSGGLAGEHNVVVIFPGAHELHDSS